MTLKNCLQAYFGNSENYRADMHKTKSTYKYFSVISVFLLRVNFHVFCPHYPCAVAILILPKVYRKLWGEMIVTDQPRSLSRDDGVHAEDAK